MLLGRYLFLFVGVVWGMNSVPANKLGPMMASGAYPLCSSAQAQSAGIGQDTSS